MWREHYGRVALKVNIEPAGDAPFEASAISRITPGLHLLLGRLSPARITRTRDLIADGNDDLALVINRTGHATLSACGREVPLADGEAMLLRSDDIATFERRSHGESLSLRVPRPVLSSLVVDIDEAVMRPVPRTSEVLRLLALYSAALMDEDALAVSGLRQLAVNHVHDLIALLLGATRDAADAAMDRGLPAARLRAAKTYVIENSQDRDLAVGVVASRLGLTPRHLQRLFEMDGTTFSAFLRSQRLARAHRMLCDAQHNGRGVGSIAYGAGFGDLSYFNRCFRKQYGLTPTDIREANAENR
jgi:AraC-like DNA-binding protein